MIVAQAFDVGRRHSKARVGDRGCWKEMEGWQLRAQFLLIGPLLQKLER